MQACGQSSEILVVTTVEDDLHLQRLQRHLGGDLESIQRTVEMLHLRILITHELGNVMQQRHTAILRSCVEKSSKRRQLEPVPKTYGYSSFMSTRSCDSGKSAPIDRYTRNAYPNTRLTVTALTQRQILGRE